ncbi:unnamed protein product [Mytilus edulis]|uniref:Uncharacterized protein n=1 Tax=Mytilus edulis TaxID=6550 RepID=A0A8S3U4N3_MYTED|nr:unnamed protein product [Mytilus edulis]
MDNKMTEPTEHRPLKRTIPPDLQTQVEDIQKKITRTTGPPDDLDDRRKRWLIVGICLHTIISPVLRTYVVPVVTKLCYSLTSRNKIHKQTYGSHLERYAPTNTQLNYEAINNNKTLYGRNRARYDYRVKSAVDLSRLFLQTHMAHFTAFDDSCDSSALLGIIVNIDRFPPVVQADARKKTNEHDETLNEHDETLNEHDETLNEHDETLNEHDETLNEHDETLNEHGETLNEHDETLNEHDETLNHIPPHIRERRRKLMKHSDVDLIETIANCYQLEENLLRKYVEENEDPYVYDACFKSLKTIYNSQKKCKQLTDTLKEKVSNNFKNLTIKLEYEHANNSLGKMLSLISKRWNMKLAATIDMDSPFTTTIPRALVTFIPELKDFRDLVTFHIEHQFSKASEKKSDIILSTFGDLRKG